MKLIFVGFFLIGLSAGLSNCIVARAEAQSEPEINHRKILNSTCFYSANEAGAITTLSCVKD